MSRTGGARRAPALVVLAALLVAGGWLDRADRPSSRSAVELRARSLMPTPAPAGALSSSWYCAGAGAAGGVLVLANLGPKEAHGRVTVVPAGGAPVTAETVVPPMDVRALPLADIAPGPSAAMVDLDVGQVAAELVMSGANTGVTDSEVVPCASSASDQWYFADGSTAKDAKLLLSLFNPFPEDAIVDLSFTTDQGRAVPADFQGIVVPGRSLVVRDIGERVRRRESLATEIAARAGRVVAAQQQVRTAAGRAGLSVTLGTPSPGTAWYFAEGATGPGLVQYYSVSNPNDREASILIEVDLEDGVVEPLERAVPAHGQLRLVLDEQAGVPAGMGHVVTVRSLDGVPVVVSRATEGTSPSPKVGRADTLGAHRAATGWAVVAGAGTTTDEWLFVANPGPNEARVSVTALSGGNGQAAPTLQDVVVAPGKRASISLGDHHPEPGLGVVLRASAPVVVERGLYDRGRPGLSATVATPLD